MATKHLLTTAALVAVIGSAHADLTVAVAVEPSARKESFTISVAGLENALNKATGQAAKVSINEDLTDVMRATRAGEFDLYIAPPQVAASALARDFELIGSTRAVERYVLVARPRFASVGALKGARLYLPQQDSIYTYVARGMLNAAGISMRDVKVEFARLSGAGATAVVLGHADATMLRESEWAEFSRQNAGSLRALATSIPVPGGLSVVMRKSMPAKSRERVTQWFGSSADSVGLMPVVQQADGAMYKAVGELGYFTPTTLPGASVVNAAQVRDLLTEGAVIVDTRSEKEYKAKHLPLAVLVPYHEKSLKDVVFDASKDDFKDLAKLSKDKPTIFSCNGAECWKSYKASKAALAAGFTKVYWFRGGLPEWEASGLTLANDGTPPPRQR